MRMRLDATRKRTTFIVLWALLWALVGAWNSGPAASVSAQGGGLAVALTGVDSQAFPEVSVYLAVRDENGLPVVGLAKEQFEVTETGQSAAEIVAARGDIAPGMDLVLALDTSVDPEPFARLLERVRAFVGTLTLEDRVAVLTFGDRAQVVQGLAGKDKALAVLGSLTPGGSYTSLHEATVAAASLAGKASSPHRAIVMITDSADNAERLSLKATLEQIQDIGVPIYLVGYGAKMARPEAQTIRQIAAATGGQSFVLPAPEEVEAPLHMADVLARQRYRVTFRSRFQADGGEHAFVVHVTHLDREGRVEGSLVARSATIQVSLPGLADGQKVGGVVYLTPWITASVPIAAVEYLLDGQPLARVTEPPYGLVWDSATVDPGARRLVVKVQDRAGNEGESSLSLEVAVPVVVGKILLPEQVEIGRELVAQAQVTALADIARVEFWLDGRSLGSAGPDAEGLYRLSADTTGLLPGEHLVTVRAEDALGRWSEARLSTRFWASAVPTPQATSVPGTSPWRQYRSKTPWLDGALAAMAFAFMGLTAIVLRWRKQDRQQVVPVELSNMGNISSRFQLRADGPGGALRFRWMLDGAPLEQFQIVEQEANAPPQPAPAARMSGYEAGGYGVGGHGVPPRQSEGPPRQSGGAGKARQTVTDALRVGSQLSSALGWLDGVLPRAVADPLRRVRSQTVAAEIKANRVANASSSLSRIASPAGGRGDRPERQEGSPGGHGAGGHGGPPRRGEGSPRRAAGRVMSTTWYQTPFVEPGEVLTLDLVVAPARPYQARQYRFRVMSRPAGQEDALPLVEEKRIRFARVLWLRRFAPALVLLAGAILLVTLLWLLGIPILGL